MSLLNSASDYSTQAFEAIGIGEDDTTQKCSRLPNPTKSLCLRNSNKLMKCLTPIVAWCESHPFFLRLHVDLA